MGNYSTYHSFLCSGLVVLMNVFGFGGCAFSKLAPKLEQSHLSNAATLQQRSP